jgi:hypothetical protein
MMLLDTWPAYDTVVEKKRRISAQAVGLDCAFDAPLITWRHTGPNMRGAFATLRLLYEPLQPNAPAPLTSQLGQARHIFGVRAMLAQPQAWRRVSKGPDRENYPPPIAAHRPLSTCSYCAPTWNAKLPCVVWVSTESARQCT